MLNGQSIGIGESLLISVVGLGVVMLELGLLALFITLMTRFLTRLTDKKVQEEQASPAASIQPAAEAQFDINISEEEIGAIIACVCAEINKRPEQLIIRSIEQK